MKNSHFQEAQSEKLWQRELDSLDNIKNEDLLERNDRKFEALNNLYQQDEVDKLEFLLRDSLFRGNNQSSLYN